MFEDRSYINVKALIRSEMTYPKGTTRPSNVAGTSDTTNSTEMTDSTTETAETAEVAETAEAETTETTTTTTTSAMDPNIQQKIDSIKNVASTIRDISASIRDTVQLCVRAEQLMN